MATEPTEKEATDSSPEQDLIASLMLAAAIRDGSSRIATAIERLAAAINTVANSKLN